MKKNVFKFFTIVAIAAAVVCCKKKADEAETKAAVDAAKSEVTSVKYMANPAESAIEWKGFKPAGTHNGTVKVETGVFTVNDGKIDSGTFLIDMSSIVVLDIPAENEMNGKLTGHLKSEDFFGVEKFPSAAFEVTGFEVKDGKSMLSGNLKMKDIENNVTFPVTLNTEGDVMSLTSEVFTIDRTKWDIKYKSKSVFSDLKDKFINDDIELKITVKASKS